MRTRSDVRLEMKEIDREIRSLRLRKSALKAEYSALPRTRSGKLRTIPCSACGDVVRLIKGRCVRCYQREYMRAKPRKEPRPRGPKRVETDAGPIQTTEKCCRCPGYAYRQGLCFAHFNQMQHRRRLMEFGPVRPAYVRTESPKERKWREREEENVRINRMERKADDQAGLMEAMTSDPRERLRITVVPRMA